MKILFVVNVDWFFISHRLPLALEAKKRGHEVFVVAGNTGLGESLMNHQITFIPWQINRSGTNIFKEIRTIFQLITIFFRIKPDLIHNIGIKSVIYSSLIAKTVYQKPYLNAIAGMGFTFSGENLKAKILKLIFNHLFFYLLKSKRSILVVQNEDDKDRFLKLGYVKASHLELIKSSGVDLNRFSLKPEPFNEPYIVCLPSRMLWDKGIGEFIEAARILKRKGLDNIRFVLVGGVDSENPASISEEQLKEWVKEEIVDWWGHQTDMPNILSQVNIVVLPSYNEGFPKVLLEAAAIGRAIITTDVVGCREFIKDGDNGILVPSKNSMELALAIEKLLKSSELRLKYIINGYEIVRNNYTIEKIVEQTFDTYNKIYKL